MPDSLLRLLPEDPDNPYRLGAHLYHDPQSAAFPFAARPEARRAISSRPPWSRRIPITNQLDIGSCTGQGGTGWVGTDTNDRPGLIRIVAAPEPPCPLGPLDNDWAVKLYGEASRIDPWPGGYYAPAWEDTGSDALSIAKTLRAWGLAGEYTWCFGGLSDVLTGLQSGPVVLATGWYSSMFTPTSDGECVISSGAYLSGGHLFIANGEIDMERQRIGCDQSWGQGWGLDGRFYLSFATLERLLSEDGEGLVLHATATINPDPEPAPEPEPARPGCNPVAQISRLFRRR